MKIIRDITSLEPELNLVCLSIGNFDGVHCGHQFLLNELIVTAKKKQTQSVVLTFENHPKTILNKKNTPQLICTLLQKISLLEQFGIDILILLPFTDAFKEQTAEEFLTRLHLALPFSDLILGHDAVLGRDRHGTKEPILAIGKTLNFSVNYLEAFKINDIPISSTLIRTFIQQGDFNSLETLLGRKYSIQNIVQEGFGKGKNLGFPTANLDVSGLCLPPLGVYAVLAEYEGQQKQAIANLGLAPTLNQNKTPVLEVHLLKTDEDLYGKELNIVFQHYIREEKTFTSTESLKAQIAADIKNLQEGRVFDA